MSTTLYIKAVPGLKFMVERKPKVRISETTPIAVKASHYYRKAIKDKDLIELSAQEWATYLAARSAATTTTTAAPAAPSAAAAPVATGAATTTSAAPSASSTTASAASANSTAAN